MFTTIGDSVTTLILDRLIKIFPSVEFAVFRLAVIFICPLAIVHLSSIIRETPIIVGTTFILVGSFPFFNRLTVLVLRPSPIIKATVFLFASIVTVFSRFGAVSAAVWASFVLIVVEIFICWPAGSISKTRQQGSLATMLINGQKAYEPVIVVNRPTVSRSLLAPATTIVVKLIFILVVVIIIIYLWSSAAVRSSEWSRWSLTYRRVGYIGV